MQYFQSRLFLIVLVLSGCDNNAPVAITDKAIYSEFTIAYDVTTDLSTADAKFWIDGKNGQQTFFNPDAQLTFQTYNLEYLSAGIYYSKQLKGFFSTSQFKVVDINKKEFVNSTSINMVEFPLGVQDTIIDLSKNFTLTWNGTALETGEYVGVRIENQIFKQTNIGSNNIVVSVSDLSVLSTYRTQSIVATIERFKTVPLKNDLGAGGYIFVHYTGYKKNFYIK